MNKLFLSAALAFLSCTAFAQELRTLATGTQNLKKLKSKEAFNFMNDGMDTTSLTYVATYEVKSPAKASIEKIYSVAQKEARNAGANTLRLKSISEDYSITVFEAYVMDADAVQINRNLSEKNVFYIFGGEKYDAPTYYSFEFNGAGKTIKNGTYFKYTLKEGEQVKLRKGTVSGTIMWVKWKHNQMPYYFSIHGFVKEVVVKRTTQSESFRPGKFPNVESSLGAFLSKVLVEKVD